MIRWVDVNEKDWFFNEVMEASNIFLEDGTPLITSMTYNDYYTDAPYLYEEQKGVKGKTVFTVSQKVVPTKSNPLFVYIDGRQTMYKSVTVNADNTSDVEFYVSPPTKSLISFMIMGKANADRFGKPITKPGTSTYPNGKLDYGNTYYFEPLTQQYQEYLYAFGRQLRRVDVPDYEWDVQDGQAIAAKYISTASDKYIVAPSRLGTTDGGRIYVPYNLDGVSVQFYYNSLEDDVVVKRGGTAVYHGTNVLFNNRFFPNAYMTRAEAYILMDKLRRQFYSRFTDRDAPTNQIDEIFTTYDGQRAFNLNGKIDVTGTGVVVMLDGTMKNRGIDYTIVSDHSILWNTPLLAGRTVEVMFAKTRSERFADVGQEAYMFDTETGESPTLQGTGTWWTTPVLCLENEKLANGEYLVTGYDITGFIDGKVTVDHMFDPSAGSYDPVQYFMSRTLMTRADSVALLNRFRKWCIENLK